jgi:hypothetical protein
MVLAPPSEPWSERFASALLLGQAVLAETNDITAGISTGSRGFVPAVEPAAGIMIGSSVVRPSLKIENSMRRLVARISLRFHGSPAPFSQLHDRLK